MLGCFVTSIHSVNNGVCKVARLSVIIRVHRGLANLKLPKRFLEKDSAGARAGVEFVPGPLFAKTTDI